MERLILQTFTTAASLWLKRDNSHFAVPAGDTVILHKCHPLTSYYVHWDRKRDGQCYHDFPITYHLGENKQLSFLCLIGRQVVHKSAAINCENRPKHTFVMDADNVYHTVTANEEITIVTKQSIQQEFTARTPPKLLRQLLGYSTNVLVQPPHHLEPITMLQIFSRLENTIAQLHQVRETHPSNNIIGSIILAIGSGIKSTAKGTSTIIHSIGHAITETIEGVSDLDEGLVHAIRNATLSVIRVTGEAIYDVEDGAAGIMKNIFGGFGALAQWIVTFLLIIAVVYLSKHDLKKMFCHTKETTPPPDYTAISYPIPALPPRNDTAMRREKALTRRSDAEKSSTSQEEIELRGIVSERTKFSDHSTNQSRLNIHENRLNTETGDSKISGDLDVKRNQWLK